MGKIKNSIVKDGILSSILKVPPYLYRNCLRPILPTIGYQKLNGIKVKPIKIGDNLLSPVWRSYKLTEKPNYESGIIKALNDNVQKGDHVLIIGGGNGVTTCIASRLVKEAGRVTCYEASKQAYNNVKKTCSLNNVPDNIRLINKSVGTPMSIWGELSNVKNEDPTRLPSCDILELDCEGTEKEILQNLKIRPNTLIVETHGLFNSSTDEVSKLIKDLDYNIGNIEIADLDLEQVCREDDIKVITAHKS